MVHVYMRGGGCAEDVRTMLHGRQSDAAWGLLWDVLAREHPLQDLPLPTERDAHGKPRFPDAPDIHFNLSHSAGYAVCALADTPVGVDVQVWRRLKRPVEGRFHPLERELLGMTDEASCREAFFCLWTAKESFMKADGRGLRIPLDAFCTVSEEELGAGSLIYDRPVRVRQEVNEGDYYVWRHRVREGVSLAACASGDGGFIYEDVRA